MSELPRVCTQIDRKARKEHKCCGCSKVIVVGELYRYTSGIWDEPNSFKHCLNCAYVLDNYKLIDDGLMPEDGPSLEHGGVRCWLQDFMCQSWHGEEAVNDLAKLFNLPSEYFIGLIL